jgi:hypothetical protein
VPPVLATTAACGAEVEEGEFNGLGAPPKPLMREMTIYYSKTGFLYPFSTI